MDKCRDEEKILRLMSQGWQLGLSFGFRRSRARAWIQLGGIGRGGDTIDIHMSTFKKLDESGKIKTISRDATTIKFALV